MNAQKRELLKLAFEWEYIAQISEERLCKSPVQEIFFDDNGKEKKRLEIHGEIRSNVACAKELMEMIEFLWPKEKNL